MTTPPKPDQPASSAMPKAIKGDVPRTKAPKPRRKPKNAGAAEKNISPASQSLISVFILAFGIAAIAAVGYLAYTRFNPAPSAPAVIAQATEEDALEETAEQAEPQIAEQPETKSPPDNASLVKANMNQISGNWVARNGYVTVYAHLKSDKTFEIVALMDKPGIERRYSAGTFDYNEEQGLLSLRAGYAPLPEMKDVRMKTLTRRSYNVIPLIDKRSGAFIWVPEIRDENSAIAHPIFALLERSGSYIVWSRP